MVFTGHQKKDAINVTKVKGSNMDVRKYAKFEHDDQKYGNMPFIYHLDMVADVVSKYGEVARYVAYLHDILEDTNAGKHTLEMIFGKRIADLVFIVTDEDGPNRTERKRLTNIKLGNVVGGSEIALVVKAADRLSNVTESFLKGRISFLKMYKKEHDEFKVAVYREGLCDEIWDRLDKIMEII